MRLCPNFSRRQCGLRAGRDAETALAFPDGLPCYGIAPFAATPLETSAGSRQPSVNPSSATIPGGFMRWYWQGYPWKGGASPSRRRLMPRTLRSSSFRWFRVGRRCPATATSFHGGPAPCRGAYRSRRCRRTGRPVDRAWRRCCSGHRGCRGLMIHGNRGQQRVGRGDRGGGRIGNAHGVAPIVMVWEVRSWCGYHQGRALGACRTCRSTI